MAFTWLITGASSGFGAAIALAALNAGHSVVATARNVAAAAKSNPRIEESGGRWVQLDVSQKDAQEIVRSTVEKYKVNVLVNNAGYALRGAMEDYSEEDMLSQLNTNVMGVFRVAKGAIPSFRHNGSGTIVNISSTSGMTGFPGFSLYAASKFAIEGASEALATELSPFGIRVLVVQPGAFRTNFQNAGSTVSLSDPYRGTAVDNVLKRVMGIGGKEPGDPSRAAKAIVDVVANEGDGKAVDDLLRLPLGADAVDRAHGKIKDFSSNVEQVQHISKSVVFPKDS